MRRILIFFLGLSLLTACTEKQPPPLPQGTQEVSGTLLPTEISLVRRGTHVLKQDGVDAYYVESKTVNLRFFEVRDVTLRGTFEYNTDPFDLFVLVVEGVEDTGERMKEWSVSALRLTLQAPVEWDGNEDGTQIQFIAEGMDAPVLTIQKEATHLSFSDFIETQENGIPIVVAQKRGIRLLDEQTGDQTIYIDRGGHILTILFTPRGDKNADELRSLFLGALRSLSFTEDPTIISTGTGAQVGGTGQPCGGPAGILCPDGLYCEVTDMEMNIGKCVRY